MDSKKYLEDISEIKNMMNRSSRFISLSGLSGILAGLYALTGGYIGYRILYTNTWEFESYKQVERLILWVALGVVFLAVVTAFILTWRKAQKSGEALWDVSSQILLINFLVPLCSGGIFILLLIKMEYWLLIAPCTLIFYGLACYNAAKFTLGHVRYLGITNIILGLLAGYFLGYGLFFWILGFGVCHIIYGTLMYLKHDRK